MEARALRWRHPTCRAKASSCCGVTHSVDPEHAARLPRLFDDVDGVVDGVMTTGLGAVDPFGLGNLNECL